MGCSFESHVIVYHDETEYVGTEKLKGHVLFFVPVKTIVKEEGLFASCQRELEPLNDLSPLNDLFKEIENIRNKFEADHKFHFSEISGKKWTKQNEAEKQVVQLGVEYLKQKKTFCKVGIIFYENPTPERMARYSGEDKREKELEFAETVLRMLLKGTVHYLYDSRHKVKILKIITDGQPYHRKLSEYRIIDRLIEELRDYVEISNDAEIIHLPSDHKKHDKNSKEYIHANLLQLADMLLGSTIYSYRECAKIRDINPQRGDFVEDKKGVIAYPVKQMIAEQWERGKDFKNSDYYKAYTISKAYIGEDGKWKFESLMAREIKISNEGQLSIFDFVNGGRNNERRI